MKLNLYLIFFVALVLLSHKMLYAQDVPTLNTPTVASGNVNFSWSSVDGATNYEIQVTTAENAPPQIDDYPSTNSYSSTLDANTYYWRVNAEIGEDEWGGWTDWSSFIVLAPPLITSYSGSYGAGWTQLLHIQGNNFGDPPTPGDIPGTVQFFCGNKNYENSINYIQASNITDWSNTDIYCFIPQFASSGAIIVTNAQGNSNNPAVGTPVYNVDWGFNGQWVTPPVNVPYQIVNLNGYKGTKYSQQQLASMINAAAFAWTSGNTSAKFNIVSNSSSNFTIGFGTLQDNTNTGETHPQRVGNDMTSVYTLINPNINWDGTNYNLQSAAEHEFGHWVSLADLYGIPDQRKVMYGTYNGLLKLTSSETDGLIALYQQGFLDAVGGGNPPTLPAAPTNVQATINGQQVTLTWNQISDPTVTIEIFKNTFITPIKSLFYNVTSYPDPNGTATLPVTYMVASNNGAGTTYSMPITISSSTISSNTNWQGTVYTNGSVIVNSGCTLTIEPGTIIYFPSGSSLTVNGLLSVYGTSYSPVTFTSIGSTSPGSWGSIVLSGSGANNSTLSNVNIQYGTEIDIDNVQNVTVQNCNITNNSGIGINFYGSTGSALYNTIANSNTSHGIYVQDGSTVTCKYNHIYKTNQNQQGVGILYSGGSGTVGENDVDFYNWGIASIWGGSIMADLNPATYNNRVTNCQVGLMVYYEGFCNFGVSTSEPSWGLNSIYNNSMNAEVGYNYSNIVSKLYAECDWWGSNPPNQNKFYVSTPATSGYFTYPLGDDPWLGIPLPAMQQTPNNKVKSGDVVTSISQNNRNGTNLSSLGTTFTNQSVITDSLLIGVGMLGQKNYGDAENFFTSYLKNHPDNQAAYIELYASANSETLPSIIQYFKALPTQAAKEQKLMLSHLYLEYGDAVSAKQVNDGIIADNPNTILGMKAKLNNFYILLYSNNDLNGAYAVLKDLENSATLLSSIEIADAQHALKFYVNPKTGVMPSVSTEQSGNGSSVAAFTSTHSVLMTNYPNPFNPSTIIQYQLPANGMVTIRVFDVLGREIKTLVNEYKSQGTYTVSFDASKLASGIYFYQIRSGNFISTKKMMYMK